MDHYPSYCSSHLSICCSLMYLLSCLPPALTAETRVVCPSKTIFATPGQDILFPCRLEPPSSVVRMTVEWTKPAGPRSNQNTRNHVHLRRDGREVLDMKDQSYSGRTSLFEDELKNGNVSLKLFRVRSSDTGRYRLFIPRLRSHMKEAAVQLVVGNSTQKLAGSGQVEKLIQMNAVRTQPERQSQGDNFQDLPLVDSKKTSNPILVICVVGGLVGGILPLSAVMTYLMKRSSFKKGSSSFQVLLPAVPGSSMTTSSVASSEDQEKLPC